MLVAMAGMLHYLLTGCRPAWIRTQILNSCSQLCWTQNVDETLTYGKPCDAPQQGVKLRGLLRDRA